MTADFPELNYIYQIEIGKILFVEAFMGRTSHLYIQLPAGQETISPLNMLLAMAPHGAIGLLSLLAYGSHSLLGSCERRTRKR